MCATHTLQLAVNDTLKVSGCGRVVEDCRARVKKLRVQSVTSLIGKLGLRKPVTNCPMQWMSTLHMLTRLIELKDSTEGFLSE